MSDNKIEKGLTRAQKKKGEILSLLDAQDSDIASAGGTLTDESFVDLFEKSLEETETVASRESIFHHCVRKV